MLSLGEAEIPSDCLPCASFGSKDAQSSALLSLADGSKLALFDYNEENSKIKISSNLIRF